MNIAVFRAAALAFALTLPLQALAMPGMQGGSPARSADPVERFHAMDADKDGVLTWEELSAARPNLNRNAFDTIDTDHNGGICLEEWKNFSAGHGASASMPDMEGMMKAMRGAGDQAAAQKEGMPLVMPPAQKAAPSGNGSLPLLVTPPAKGN